MKQTAGQHLESFKTANSTRWKAKEAIWTLGGVAASCSAALAWGVSPSPWHCSECDGCWQCLMGSGCGTD